MIELTKMFRPELPTSARSFWIGRSIFLIAVIWEFTELYMHRLISFNSFVNLSVHSPVMISEYLLPLTILALILSLFDIFPRFLMLFSYISSKIFLSYSSDLNTFDAFILEFLLIFSFVPLPRIKELWKQDQKTNPILSLLVFIFFIIVYLTSAYSKFHSPVWLRGEAFYYSSIFPNAGTGIFPHILKQPWIIKFNTYWVMFYESAFALILFPIFRIPIFLFGLALHLGTMVFLPIPTVGLMVLGVLIIFFPFADRTQLISILKSKNLFYGSELDKKSHFAWRRAIPLFVLSSIVCLQILHSTVSLNRGSILETLARTIPVNNWGVYLDGHWFNNNPLYRFTIANHEKEEEIDSFNTDGYPTVRGRYWLLLNFGLRTEIGSQTLLYRYVSGYLKMKKITYGKVRIYKKDVSISPEDFDMNLDEKIKNRPWELFKEIPYSDLL